MKNKIIALCLVLALLAAGVSCAAAEGSPSAAVVNLKTLGRVNPVGIDAPQPAFSWQMRSDAIGAAQAAYQITVWDEDGNVAWDSGAVESAESVGIPYEGEALAPSTVYTWQVAVTDQTGAVVTSEPATFTTALMDDSFDAWDGAQWIGSPRLPLDAASKSVFHISADVTLAEGSDRASFILGANDYRLTHAAFNPKLLEGENYVRVELDLSGLTSAGGAKVNVYRKGYDPDDDSTVPFATAGENEELDAILTEANKYEPHHVDIFCTNSTLTFTVDDVVVNATPVAVAEMGNCYPHLNSVGFAMNAGESTKFANYKIENGGKFARGILLDDTNGFPDQTTGWFFDEQEGVEYVEGGLSVDGGDNGVLFYKDPSHDGAPYLRRSFELKGPVKKAYLYITAQGIYDLTLNGWEIGALEWFNPGSTEYDSILGYNMYNVTDFLDLGVENTMDAVLGEGWWTGMTTFEPTNNNYYGDQPALMAKLVIDYADGTSETIVTDESWECFTKGPVKLASLFQGERYDARMEDYTETDWETSGWTSAAVIPTRKQFANPRLVTRYDEPVHVIREITAEQCLGESREGSGSYIYDMGENLVGVPNITIPAECAKEGETLIIRYAEILYPELQEYIDQGVNGMLMVENLRSALATDFYTMRDNDHEQVFCPELTFHGYRYVEITGLDQPLPTECVGMKVLSSLDATAVYESSDELVDRLFENIVNSTTGNYLSIPTDCPQRDERMGWTGDAQVYALSATYAADTYPFMRQWMDTVRADCGPTGMSSQYCPAFVAYDIDNDDAVPHKGQSFGITWNCLVVTIPYNLYMQTGDKAIVRDNYDNIRAYVDHLIDTPLTYKDENKEKHEEPRLTGETGTLCDHLARIPTDGVSLGNAVFIACLDEAAVMADAMDDADTAQRYRDTAASAREAWNALFIDPETGMTKNAKGVIQDTQASYATPIRFNVISEANLPRALEHYLRTLSEPNLTDSDGLEVPPYTITTGFNATGNVLPALSMHGMNDAAYKLFEATDYASWLYPVTQGATSIWERWNGYTNELGFNGNNSMNSFNHYSFGAVYEWMMAYQLGIAAGDEAGYQRFVLQPTVGGGFDYAGGSFESAYGAIESAWTAAEGAMTTYDATVPANTSATLYLPAGGEVAPCEGVNVLGRAVHNGVDCIEIELAAGSYHFEIAEGAIAVTAE